MPKKSPYPGGESVISWVSTEWLADHLADDKLIILDCQPDIHDYILEHIPRAVYLNPNVFRVPKYGIPGKFVPAEIAQKLFRRLALKADKPAVVYSGRGGFKGWGDGLEQTMIAFCLALYGHNRVYLLDGGLTKWKKEQRKTRKVFPKALKESDFQAKSRRKEYLLEYEAFKELKDQEDVILLDARPEEFYQGEGPWIKPGHIPGAINLPWTKLMVADNPRQLKPEEEIRTILKKKGITPLKTIICSCGTGREATNQFLLFKFFLGYPDVKLYEGSFTEWTAYPENPTVVGKKPR